MSIYIYKIWNYRTVTHPHRTKVRKARFLWSFQWLQSQDNVVWNIYHIVYFDIWYTKNLNPPIWNLLWLKSLWYVLNVSITEQWKNMIGIVREAI